MAVRKHASTLSRGPRASRGSLLPPREGTAPNPFIALLKGVQPDVEQRLGKLLDERVTTTRRLGPEVQALVREIRRLALSGGKRLRPALVVAGFRAAGARGDAGPAFDAGVALELLHTYLLIHDDWMDQDAVRRGGPSVHVALAKRFGSEHMGNAAAILAGDYAVALATEALANVAVPQQQLRQALGVFTDMQLFAVAGQQLDMVGSGRDVELVYALKTGSYTVEGPLKLGALLGGAKKPLLDALTRYARPAGIAFQLRDDVLSLFGDPAQTGKPFASDLMSGKRTLLLQLALKRAKPAGRQVIDRVLGNARAKAPALERALEVIRSTGAVEQVEQRIAVLSADALKEVERIAPEGRALLVGATEALSLRRT
jgi:geranylgeranyl diphosphate synthase type I